MICSNCGKEIKDGQFCTACGTAVLDNSIAESEAAVSERFVTDSGTATSGEFSAESETIIAGMTAGDLEPVINDSAMKSNAVNPTQNITPNPSSGIISNPSPNTDSNTSYNGMPNSIPNPNHGNHQNYSGNNQNQYYAQGSRGNNKGGGYGAVIAIIAVVFGVFLLCTVAIVFFIFQMKNVERHMNNYYERYEDYDEDYDLDYDYDYDYDEEYAYEEFMCPESNIRYLYMMDIEGFTAYQCIIARNEIYARHGRRFEDTELQKYFDSCSWYEGTVNPEDFDESVLNSFEIANIHTISGYEHDMGYRE